MTPHSPSAPRIPKPHKSGLRIGQIFGVTLVADWSLLVIFGLIMLNLGISALPQWHPDWSAWWVWSIALTSAILFIASIALHELAHALVARRYGVPVRRITLFIFGGVAHVEREPPSPQAEFWIAAMGPITSLVLGFCATVVGVWLANDTLQQLTQAPESALARLGPASTILLWLGPINILLAIFNLLPGFPLDGGRVLRAILWASTHNLQRATRWASRTGQGFAWLLISAGVAMMLGIALPFFGTGLLAGLWMILIGWFLNNAAKSSYQQLLIRDALCQVHVRDVMRAQIEAIDPHLSVAELAKDMAHHSEQRAFPVLAANGHLEGMVLPEQVRAVPQDEWSTTYVETIMTVSSEFEPLTPGDDAMRALERLNSSNLPQIPVVENNHLIGLVQRQDILRWLALHTDLAYA